MFITSKYGLYDCCILGYFWRFFFFFCNLSIVLLKYQYYTNIYEVSTYNHNTYVYTCTYIPTCTDKTLLIQILYIILLGDQIDLLVTNDCDFTLSHDKDGCSWPVLPWTWSCQVLDAGGFIFVSLIWNFIFASLMWNSSLLFPLF